MPWNSVALPLDEGKFDDQARIFAFKRPNGKMAIVVANRSRSAERPFAIATELPAGTAWQGYRYTPDETGSDTRGVPIGTATGGPAQPQAGNSGRHSERPDVAQAPSLFFQSEQTGSPRYFFDPGRHGGRHSDISGLLVYSPPKTALA